MKDSIVLSAEQEDAVSAMMSGRNVFLTGEAGTGKSTVVREFHRRCGDECIVLAPTGIAALNAGGSTIHSFFMLPTGLMTVDSVGAFSSWSRIQVIHEARAIIIDDDGGGASGGDEDVSNDEYEKAKQVVITTNRASISHLQRQMRIGYNHAAKIIDLLEARSVIGPARGAGPREVLVAE